MSRYADLAALAAWLQLARWELPLSLVRRSVLEMLRLRLADQAQLTEFTVFSLAHPGGPGRRPRVPGLGLN